MKNILLAIDASKWHTGSLEFACYLAKLTDGRIHGVFLEYYSGNTKSKPKRNKVSLTAEYSESNFGDDDVDERVSENIRYFRDACARRSVPCIVTHNQGEPAEDIIALSRYADLIVIDPATSFEFAYEGMPTDFARDILKDAECPVIIAPENFNSVDEIVFACDYSAASMYAIRQFCYHFPAYAGKDLLVLQVSENKHPASGQSHLESWAGDYFGTVKFRTLEGSPGETSYKLMNELFLRENVFIVMGAYGRSDFSRFFKHSKADLLVKTINQPVFIAHS